MLFIVLIGLVLFNSINQLNLHLLRIISLRFLGGKGIFKFYKDQRNKVRFCFIFTHVEKRHLARTTYHVIKWYFSGCPNFAYFPCSNFKLWILNNRFCKRRDHSFAISRKISQNLEKNQWILPVFLILEVGHKMENKLKKYFKAIY